MRSVLAKLLRRARREDGQVIPLVALLLIVIMGMAAFAVDVSGWYFDQRHLQMQADSAVLAGASKFVGGTGTCSTQKQGIIDTSTSYAGLPGNIAPISSNNEPGNVTGQINVDCINSYIDATLTNSSPASFFSGVFGIHPSVAAHARASLEQVTAEGGSQVLPYAIEQSKTALNNQLIQITVNSSPTKQALVCDGSGASNATSTTEMYNLQLSGCPKTHINTGGTTCPPVQANPPTCLWQFTGVSESDGFDAGHVYRFENGSPWPNSDKCINPNPIPTNNYPTIVPGDPRVITVFVVPNGSFTTTTHLIPILGYATFYMAGWDHDPCVGSSDPKNPGPQGNAGTIWGYFIGYTNPEGPNVEGSGPCAPNPNYAYTSTCVYKLSQ